MLTITGKDLSFFGMSKPSRTGKGIIDSARSTFEIKTKKYFRNVENIERGVKVSCSFQMPWKAVEKFLFKSALTTICSIIQNNISILLKYI